MTKLMGGVPLDSNGGVPVNLQDQTTRMVFAPLHSVINDSAALASPGAIDDLTVTMVAGHGASAGNVLVLRELDRWFFAGILNVATNVLTLDTPLDYAFTTDAMATIGNPNLAQNGAVTPVSAVVAPPPGVDWDIVRLHLSISDDAAMDFTTFGGISAITNGIVFGRYGGPVPINVGNAKTNGALITFSDSYSFEDKVGGGEYSFSARYIFGGQSGVGVTMRCHSDHDEVIRILIQDNLSAISSFQAIAIGHVVEY